MNTPVVVRPLHHEHERQDGEGHEADEPEQIDEGEHLRLTPDLERHQRTWSRAPAGSAHGPRGKAAPRG